MQCIKRGVTLLYSTHLPARPYRAATSRVGRVAVRFALSRKARYVKLGQERTARRQTLTLK